GGSLLDHVRSIVEITARDTTRLAPDDWTSLPGLDRAPPLPGGRDSLLAGRDVAAGGRVFPCHARRLPAATPQTTPRGGAEMTQQAVRDVETWTAPDAPILGIVRASATIRSERALSRPVPGVPSSGPRTWRYSLVLVSAGPQPHRARR